MFSLRRKHDIDLRLTNKRVQAGAKRAMYDAFSLDPWRVLDVIDSRGHGITVGYDTTTLCTTTELN